VQAKERSESRVIANGEEESENHSRMLATWACGCQPEVAQIQHLVAYEAKDTDWRDLSGQA